MQKIMLIGNLTRDVEMRYTPGGKAVANFSMATNNWKKEPTWWRVTVWEKLAESCNEHLAKGRQVYVEGEMNTDNGNPRVYQRSDGTWAAQYEITARSVEFLGGQRQVAQQTDEDDVPPF